LLAVNGPYIPQLLPSTLPITTMISVIGRSGTISFFVNGNFLLCFEFVSGTIYFLRQFCHSYAIGRSRQYFFVNTT
jgi:hypothetical protein